MDYKFSNDIPKHYWRNRSLLTNFLNGLHLLFPPGEKYMVRMINQAGKELQDPKLREMARSFGQQEMQHSMEHQKVVDLLREKGYNTELFDTIAGVMKDFFENKVPLNINIALIAGIEHFTALIGNIALSDESILEDVHPEIRELLRWHAAEEIEHKAVAFDVSNAMGNSYALRAASMIVAGTLVYGFITALMLEFTRQDKKLFSLETLEDFGYLFFGDHMLFPRTFKEFIKYFSPGFHPNSVEDYYLAEEVFTKLKEAG